MKFTIHTFMERLYDIFDQVHEAIPPGTPTGEAVTGRKTYRDIARNYMDRAKREGWLTWRDILDAYASAALAESDPTALIQRLYEVTAVVFEWIVHLSQQIEQSTPEKAKSSKIDVESLTAIRVRREETPGEAPAIAFMMGVIPARVSPVVARKMAQRLLELTSPEDVG
jgi:hypothetical protein